MQKPQELADLEVRLTAVVQGTCNTVGCANCGLKHGGYDAKECAATDLQGRILDIEMTIN